MTNDDDGTTSGSDPAGTIDPVAKKGRSRGVRVTYAAAVALGLAVGSGAIAGAATGGSSTTTTPTTPTAPDGPGWHGGFGGSPPAAVGEVATVGTNTFTLASRGNVTVTVQVTATTTYVDPTVSSPTFATVKVGDHVAVFGTDTSNTVAATRVAVGGPGGPGHSFGGAPPAAVGTVATVGVGSFTVTIHDNTTVTVDVTGTTTYVDPAVSSPTFATVKVGENVAVFGADTAHTVTATRVAIGAIGGPGGPGGPGGRHGFGGTPPAAVGTVASVGVGSFTVTTPDNTTVTVDVSGTTTYQDPGVTSPGITDLKVGDRVAVFGTDTNNTVAATQVCIGGSALPSGPGGPGDHDGFGGPGGPGGGPPPAFGGTPTAGASVGSTTSFGSAGSTLN